MAADQTERLRAALAGRYEIEGPAGVGGMATVYRARDLKHDRAVAIKVLRPELAASLGADRFLREISIAARLQHPHILPLFDSGEADGFLYYVMPFVEGESLRGRLVRETELPIQSVVRILRDVADALAYAHAQGVVHRDIKPDNVMFSGAHAVVADFGVAKAVSAATQAAAHASLGVALGTPSYMAPEQAAADPAADHRADIYSMGALAYEMLAGQPVFTAPTPQALLAAHVAERPEPVSAHRPSVPAALEQLVMKCLEKKPADRWQSAGDLLPHLEAMLTPTGVLTPAPGPRAFRARRWVGRHWRLAAVALVLLAAALIALRALGIWPVPSLVASGHLAKDEPIVLADFDNLTPDSTLGPTVTELMRVQMSRSRDVRLMDQARVTDALRRMRRDPSAPLTLAVAREVAVREGVRAAIAGEVRAADGGYLVSARLVAAGSGEPLAAYQQAAAGQRDLWEAVERLSGRLQRRIGESLLRVGRGEPLSAVTTSSLEALRRYTQGARAELRGDFASAIALDREAVAIDSSFAMAWRKLGVLLEASGAPRTEVILAYERALHFGDRLTETERLHTSAMYYFGARNDPARAASEFRTLLDLYPGDGVALNNLSSAYNALGQWAQAESTAVGGIRVWPTSRTLLVNLAIAQAAQGRPEDARRTLLELRSRAGASRAYDVQLSLADYASGRVDTAQARLSALAQDASVDPRIRRQAFGALASLSALHGRLADAEANVTQAADLARQSGSPSLALATLLTLVDYEHVVRGDTAAALRRMTAILASEPPARLSAADRPYSALVQTAAWAGDVGRARALLAEADALPDSVFRFLTVDSLGIRGLIALAAGRPREAVALISSVVGLPYCAGVCGLFALATACERAGLADSALATYERFVRATSLDRLGEDATVLPVALRRLGALLEARGENRRAAAYYRRLADLWAGADRELQPIAQDARRRAQRLEAAGN